MTATAVDQEDLERLESLLRELIAAGRAEEADTVARAYQLVQESLHADLFAVGDDDPEFIQDMEAAERDIAAGRLAPHADVLRRMRLLDDA